MTAKNAFFEEHQGAAVLKHAALRRYAPKFIGKLGKTSKDGRIVICDGYAGPGRYDDGSAGSPVVLAELAEGMPWRTVELICVERDHDQAANLSKELAPFSIVHHVLQGDFEDHLDRVLEIAGDSPLLAFLDPFGMGAPMEELRRLLDRDPVFGGGYHGGPPTEILMNFSLSGLRRNAGHLTSDSTDERYLKARASILRKLDDWMGGDEWRDLWTPGGGEDVLKAIVSMYLKKLAGPRAWHVSPASDRWDGPAVYLLALFTASNHGLWEFNDALSYARREFYDFAHRDRLALDPFPGWAKEWEAEIAANLEELLKKGPVRIQGALGAILGSSLGWAREMHIRAAIKKLRAEGKTLSEGKGKLFGSVVLPP